MTLKVLFFTRNDPWTAPSCGLLVVHQYLMRKKKEVFTLGTGGPLSAHLLPLLQCPTYTLHNTVVKNSKNYHVLIVIVFLFVKLFNSKLIYFMLNLKGTTYPKFSYLTNAVYKLSVFEKVIKNDFESINFNVCKAIWPNICILYYDFKKYHIYSYHC